MPECALHRERRHAAQSAQRSLHHGVTQLLEQPVTRDDLVRMEEEDGEQRPLTRAGQWPNGITIEHFEWAEDPEFQVVRAALGDAAHLLPNGIRKKGAPS